MGVTAAYSRLVVARPCLVILGVILLTCAFIAGAILRGIMPDFENAGRGFEASGTALAGRLYAVGRALETSQCNQEISALPGGVKTQHYFASYPEDNAPDPLCPAPAPGGDTCRYANDGKCDVGSTSRSLCAPNTDVTDCTSGRRLSLPPLPEENENSPIIGRRLQTHTRLPATATSRTCYGRGYPHRLTRTWGIQLVFDKGDESSDLLSGASLRGVNMNVNPCSPARRCDARADGATSPPGLAVARHPPMARA